MVVDCPLTEVIYMGFMGRFQSLGYSPDCSICRRTLEQTWLLTGGGKPHFGMAVPVAVLDGQGPSISWISQACLELVTNLLPQGPRLQHHRMLSEARDPRQLDLAPVVNNRNSASTDPILLPR